MSSDRMFSSESSSSDDDSDEEQETTVTSLRPSSPKKTFMTVKLLGRKGYDNFSSSSDSSASPPPSPTYKASSTSAKTGATEPSKIGITIKKSPNSYETKPLSGKAFKNTKFTLEELINQIWI